MFCYGNTDNLIFMLENIIEFRRIYKKHYYLCSMSFFLVMNSYWGGTVERKHKNKSSNLFPKRCIMKIKFLLCAVLISFPAVLSAQTIKGDVLVSGDGAPIDYKIPEGIREIAPNAFATSSVRSVECPASLEVIGQCAFFYANSLKTVTFAPNSKLKVIGEQAFSDCASLETIELPNSVDSIGTNAFVLCENLKKIAIPTGLKKLSRSTFMSCSNLMKVKFPETLKEIDETCFANCVSLTSITLTGVETIGERAFYNCKVLTNVKLNEGLKEIKANAFQRCIALETLELPATVEKTGAKLFLQCPEFGGFTVAAATKYMTAVGGVLYSKDKTTLYECPQVIATDNFVVPAETKVIRSMAFFECQDIKAITLPANIEKIGTGALANNGMTKFNFATNNNFVFADDALYYRSPSGNGLYLMAVPCKGNRTDFVLQSKTSYIADYAFAYNNNVQKVYIPDLVIGIANRAFYACHGLKDIYSYRETAPELGEEVFGDVEFNKVYLHVRKGSEKSYTDNGWMFLWGDNIEGDYPNIADGIGNVATENMKCSVVRLNANEACLTANVNISSVELYNAAGSLVSEVRQFNSNKVLITLPYHGFYIAKLKFNDGSVKVVKI